VYQVGINKGIILWCMAYQISRCLLVSHVLAIWPPWLSAWRKPVGL